MIGLQKPTMILNTLELQFIIFRFEVHVKVHINELPKIYAIKCGYFRSEHKKKLLKITQIPTF